jgi:PadR family transcriptional regulator, regulatory protein AphA
MSRWDVPPKLTSTSYGLLGLLSLRSWTTYELTKQVRRSLHWFWPRAERKLYDEPKRLVAAGYARAADEHTGRRPRTVYRITPAGRRALRRWLGEPAEPPALEFEGMVKLFFADAGTSEQLDRNLAAIEDTARTRLEALSTMAEESLDRVAPFPGRAHITAVSMRFQFEHEMLLVEWARWAREQAGRWEAPNAPGEYDWAGVITRAVEDARARLGASAAGA